MNRFSIGSQPMHRILFALLAAVLFDALPLWAQSGAGGLTGYVKDQQGAILPGVTVTATGPDLLVPVGELASTPASLTSASAVVSPAMLI